MNNVKLLHIKCCLFQFFNIINSPVTLKTLKNSVTGGVDLAAVHMQCHAMVTSQAQHQRGSTTQ